MEDFRPLDRAVLRPCRGCACTVRTLLCGGEVLFGFLPPGAYALTLERGKCRMVLLVRLPPGGRAQLCCFLAQGRCHWSSLPPRRPL